MERAPAICIAADFIAALGLLSGQATADETRQIASSATSGQADAQPGVLLPIVAFRADASGNDLFDALQTAHMFAHLSKEAPGSPIQLRLYHTVHPAHVDAKNFFSGLLMVGTLGLAPVIMSGEHTMHYELYVNGQRLLQYEYSAKLSRNEHLNGKATDTTHGLGPDGVVWAKSTVDMFLKDLANDRSVHALNDEYQVYFGNNASTVGVGGASKP